MLHGVAREHEHVAPQDVIDVGALLRQHVDPRQVARGAGKFLVEIRAVDDEHEPQPSLAKRCASPLVLPSLVWTLSSTTSLPSACLAESAVLSARRRTFFWIENSWLRTTGPKITAPPRNCGDRKLPWRARPVPFCFHGFLVVPWMSLMPLVLWVPARRLASCHWTTRARMSLRTGKPNTSSASSMSPAALLSRLFTVSFTSCLRLAPLAAWAWYGGPFSCS